MYMVLTAMAAFVMQSPMLRVFATGDAAAGGASGGLSSLFDNGLKMADFAFDLFDLVVAHPVLSLFVAVGLISLAARLVGKFAGVSKSIGS